MSCQTKEEPESNRLFIHDNWVLELADENRNIPADVPGCFHLDLMKQEMIPDPFYHANEISEQIVELEEKDWVYQTHFDLPTDLYRKNNIELVFEGLDTYAEVYLNNQQILVANNMFRTWHTDIKGKVMEKGNTLKIKFLSPVSLNEELAKSVPYQLPDIRAWTRKAPYQFGWDWGPRIVTSGIWRPVYLKAWDHIKIDNIQVIQKSLEEDLAQCKALIEITAREYEEIEFDLKMDGKSLKSTKIEVRPGNNLVKLNFEIEDPQLWWPKGMGDQKIYHLELKATVREMAAIVEETSFGLRTVELVQKPDEVGKSFFFRVNGKDVFMKGANYIPQDNFLTRVDEERYENLIKNAANANMNMLRVWGGGIYEEDVFYDLCDKYGLLVWQDFMFACNMYPGDQAFVENVKQEAIDNVKRLRNHPCIAMWCGNNEVDEGWHNWGWQKSLAYSDQDSAEVWEAYEKVFHEVLPAVVESYDGSRPYWPSSPGIGWGHEESRKRGDAHYWGVWWGEEPFEVYEEKVGRFMSEYGFQGFPSMHLLEKFLAPEDLTLDSETLKVHQKHPRGMELIQTYMEREFPVPDDFAEYNYVSQLLQAYGMTTAIEAHRRAKPYCMGTLYWQLNDCWPVISWAGLDYEGNWKALHYFVKKAYDDVLISFDDTGEDLRIFVVNDSYERLTGSLDMVIAGFTGEEMETESISLEIESNSSQAVLVLNKDDLQLIKNKAEVYLSVSFSERTNKHSSLYYFKTPKELLLPDPELELRQELQDDVYIIYLNSKNLAKNVFITSNVKGHFDDNYFDLQAGEERIVEFKTESTINKDIAFSVITLNDIILR